MTTTQTLQVLQLDLPSDDDRSARAASLRSRDAVQEGDKERWLALFTEDGLVADPVGPSVFDESGNGHRTAEQRAAFWDSAIAPNRVHMDIYRSHACANQVANVATVITTLGDGSQAEIDIVAVYTVEESTGLIESMRVYWEMEAMRFRAPGD
ncbi:MAG: nuclear transport factor 2 family protein [Microthrixaceae bacterium]|nr:nuclear transport factor 2 family protein [Microthrixaceae bacterium]